MDVHPPGYTKGTACEYLYQKLNIPKENTYAFGDGENDTEMLHLVGTSIAMGNADDEVKKHASTVTLTVAAGIRQVGHGREERRGRIRLVLRLCTGR